MLFPLLAHVTRFRHHSLFLLPQHDLLMRFYLLMVAYLLVYRPQISLLRLREHFVCRIPIRSFLIHHLLSSNTFQ